MRKLMIAALIFLVGCSGGESVAGAEKAIAQFHVELNAGQFDRIYDQASGGFKQATPRADVIKFLSAVHDKLGPFEGGKNSGWRVNYNTAGNNVAVQFQSKYQNGTATESFVFVGDSKSPRLLNYNITSNALVTS